MSASLRERIEDFLSYKRIALVGLSRDSKDFSRMLYRELKSRGYDMVPVNPSLDDVEGERCFHRVSEIQPPVDGALLLVPSGASESVVQDCAHANVSRIWFYRAFGDGAVSNDALQVCEQNGISAVPGECPFMFLAGGAWYHGVHRFCRKLVGTFPQ
jgi:predicted CoA-binding protein